MVSFLLPSTFNQRDREFSNWDHDHPPRRFIQTSTLTLPVVAYAAVFTTILCGIKTVDDATDYAYDRSIGKRTVAVVLGRQRARRLAHLLMATGMVVVVLLAAVGVFPPTAVAAPILFAIVLAVSRKADAKHAAMLLIRGSYVFLAALVVAAWFRPLR